MCVCACFFFRFATFAHERFVWRFPNFAEINGTEGSFGYCKTYGKRNMANRLELKGWQIPPKRIGRGISSTIPSSCVCVLRLFFLGFAKTWFICVHVAGENHGLGSIKVAVSRPRHVSSCATRFLDRWKRVRGANGKTATKPFGPSGNWTCARRLLGPFYIANGLRCVWMCAKEYQVCSPLRAYSPAN